MKYFKVVLVITLVAAFSAGILSVADILSKDKIEENRKEEINRSIQSIMPQTERIEKEDKVYKTYDNSGRLLGYIFVAEGQGYQGKIEIICGINPGFSAIKGIEILSSTETPGLGAKINSDSFKNQFNNLRANPNITYTKSEPTKDNQIKAITGATVSSRSVVNILNQKISQLRKKFKK